MPISTSRTAIEQVEQTLLDACQRGASDIHLEPGRGQWTLRLRVDGLLHPGRHIGVDDGTAMLARWKVMANLDITEKRRPQDGRCHWVSERAAGTTLDLRLSTLPTLHGEKLVVRLLTGRSDAPVLDRLGMPDAQLQQFRRALLQPQGLILVTGPTGAGKTSSLYAALQERNTPSVNLSTVEDPVEIALAGVNQVPVRPELGLDFAATLRALLRQDPDIIMVGEIRDRETATMALRAAQTGHLVLSTLHTNSALEALNRLERLGAGRADVLESLLLVMAQRLVRRICRCCRGAEVGESPARYPRHDAGSLTSVSSCPECHNGYRGRTGLYEVALGPTLTGQWPSDATLATTHSLWDAGRKLVADRVTTQAELDRVLGQRG